LQRPVDVYPLGIALANDHDARAFVRALGLDPREGITRFRMPMSAQWHSILIFSLVMAITALPVFALLAIHPVGLFVLAMWIVFGFSLMRALRRTVTIGGDGVLIEGFPKRFVSYSDVASIEREERSSAGGVPMVSRGFFLVLRSGQRIFLNTMQERLREGMFEGDYLFDAAVSAHVAASHGAAAATAALFRGDRTTSEWLLGLRTAGESRYRVAALREEELLSILGDPKADPTARAGAAICLAANGDDAREKIRIAAEEIAAPKLRAAIDAALEGDEDTLERALEVL